MATEVLPVKKASLKSVYKCRGNRVPYVKDIPTNCEATLFLEVD